MNCEKCSEKFSGKSDPLIPRILTNCGHTICHQCFSGLPKNLAILKILKDFDDGKYVEASDASGISNQNPDDVTYSEHTATIPSDDIGDSGASDVKFEIKLNLNDTDSGVVVGNCGIQMLGARIEDMDLKIDFKIKAREENQNSGAQNPNPLIQNFTIPIQQTQNSNHRPTPEVQISERRQEPERLQNSEIQNQNQMPFPEGFMECKICLRKFSGKVANRTPRILTDCGHTICHNCCVRIEDAGWIVCPFDREETKLHGNSVDFLQKNYYILEMLEILKDVFPDSEEPDEPTSEVHTAREIDDFAGIYFDDSDVEDSEDQITEYRQFHVFPVSST